MTQLAGRVLETALGAELTEHLGYPPGRRRRAAPATSATAPPPRRSQTELGPVQVRTPRDRHGTFEPQLVRQAPDAPGRPG